MYFLYYCIVCLLQFHGKSEWMGEGESESENEWERSFSSEMVVIVACFSRCVRFAASQHSGCVSERGEESVCLCVQKGQETLSTSVLCVYVCAVFGATVVCMRVFKTRTCVYVCLDFSRSVQKVWGRRKHCFFQRCCCCYCRRSFRCNFHNKNK